MRYQRIAFSLLTIFTVISTPVISSLEIPLGGLTAWGQTVDSKKAEADRLFQEGLDKSGNGKIHEAIQFHEQALNIYRQLSFKAGIGLTLGNLGIAYSSLGDTQKAIKFYQQSLVIARELNDKLREGNALNNIGLAYINIGQYTNASATLL